MARSEETHDIRGSKPPASAMPLKVVVVSGANQGKEVALEGSLDVGSDPTCGLCLDDRAVSRRHLTIEPRGGQVAVKDLGSRNGTFIGGTRIGDAQGSVGSVLPRRRRRPSMSPPVGER